MLLAPKPMLDLLAGWRYLVNRDFREQVNAEWQTQPTWVRAIQVAVGICSIVFPVMILAMLGFVFVTRHF